MHSSEQKFHFVCVLYRPHVGRITSSRGRHFPSHVRFCHHLQSKRRLMEPTAPWPSAPPRSHASPALPGLPEIVTTRLAPRADRTQTVSPTPHRLRETYRSWCLDPRHRCLHAPKLKTLSLVETEQAKSQQKPYTHRTPVCGRKSPPQLEWVYKCSFLLKKNHFFTIDVHRYE